MYFAVDERKEKREGDQGRIATRLHAHPTDGVVMEPPPGQRTAMLLPGIYLQSETGSNEGLGSRSALIKCGEVPCIFGDLSLTKRGYASGGMDVDIDRMGEMSCVVWQRCT